MNLSLHAGARTNRISPMLTLAAFVLAGSICSVSVKADEQAERDAIRRGANAVWADREEQSVTSSNGDLAHTDVSDRHDSEFTPTTRRAFWDDWFGSNGNSSYLSDVFEWFFYTWRYLLIMFIVITLTIVLVMLFRNAEAIGFWFRGSKNNNRGQEDLAVQKAKISELPFDLAQPVGGLLQQAERLRASGDYSRALIYLFSYALVELDQAQCIRLERGKTNGAYLRELRPFGPIRGFSNDLVGAFENVFFGKHGITRESLDQIWNRLPSFERFVTEAKGSRDYSGVGGVAQ